MKSFLPACLSLVLATAISGAELVTSKYPRTFFLLRRCGWLYGYMLTYGLISFVVTLGLQALIEAKAIGLEGVVVGNPWAQAAFLGLATKALLHIRFLTVTVGSEQFPIGIETLVRVFEPYFLEGITLHEFNNMRSFIQPRLSKYPNLKTVKAMIKSNLPTTSVAAKKVAEIDISRLSTVGEALEYYLTKFGRTSLDRVFPA
jgi:hypothetical protein